MRLLSVNTVFHEGGIAYTSLTFPPSTFGCYSLHNYCKNWMMGSVNNYMKGPSTQRGSSPGFYSCCTHHYILGPGVRVCVCTTIMNVKWKCINIHTVISSKLE